VKTKIKSEKVDIEDSFILKKDDFVMTYGWYIPDLHKKYISNESEG
jgi:hypothetical protein